MTPAERNAAISQAMGIFFDMAAKKKYRPLDPVIAKDLGPLFNTHVWGFREILLVIVHARLLNREYRASTAFYDCEPRAMFEGPIRTQLIDRRIPHRQSGPLNVAKAAKGIDDVWAAQREPQELALATVRLVKKIEAMPKDELVNFAIALHQNFLETAVAVKALDVETKPESDPRLLMGLAVSMIDKVPDSGNTPQRIIGLLLDTYHKDINSGIEVRGYDDRASVASTTSKKLCDITELRADGTVSQSYEITVKPFGQARVTECSASIAQYNSKAKTSISEVLVICRARDVHPDAKKKVTTSALFGALDYGGLVFYFLDIYEWIMSQLLRMSATARLGFYERLEKYVREPNTAESVKHFWKEHQEK